MIVVCFCSNIFWISSLNNISDNKLDYEDYDNDIVMTALTNDGQEKIINKNVT